jgi:hypothetical protein
MRGVAYAMPKRPQENKKFDGTEVFSPLHYDK